ncbi:mitochondrial import inner membrane translocase subunit TIM50-A-like [Artemia franciscana]|uniref:Mitochondrial import inner membrane translocase subunit TIM50 n=1 Tax=Artemia franciscana TaxID=6661 RepID=A0AA88HCV5_ARTSF|nr:hypothetical protein QYM36_015642 [Artemia franciscana]
MYTLRFLRGASKAFPLTPNTSSSFHGFSKISSSFTPKSFDPNQVTSFVSYVKQTSFHTLPTRPCHGPLEPSKLSRGKFYSYNSCISGFYRSNNSVHVSSVQFSVFRTLKNSNEDKVKTDLESKTEKPRTNFLQGFSKLEGSNIESLDAPFKTNAPNQQEDEDQKKKDEDAKKSMRTLKISFSVLGIVIFGVSGYLVARWGLPVTDPNGNVERDDFSDIPIPLQYFARTWNATKEFVQSIKDPSDERLLPNPLTEPYFQPPYTVVLELTGILVHPDWTYQTGWRFKKRPGIDFFLSQAGPPVYEIVIYTQENAFTAYPITEALDPKGYIMYKLFRDQTKYVNGVHMKDLGSLNRDLSKVIVIDWNDKALATHPRNLLRLKKWNGEDTDKSLFDLALLLKAIASSGVSDVREVLDYYRQFDDPLEAFRENQRKVMEAEEERQRHLKEAKPSWTPSIFGRKF